MFFNFSWDLRQYPTPTRETENNAFGGTTKSIIMVLWKRPLHSRRSEIHNYMRKLIVTSSLNCWTINIPVCPMNYLPNLKSLPQNINWMTVWKFWTFGGANTNPKKKNDSVKFRVLQVKLCETYFISLSSKFFSRSSGLLPPDFCFSAAICRAFSKNYEPVLMRQKLQTRPCL